MIGLEYFRRRNNMSVTDLANKIGVSRQSVSKWEKKEQKIPIERIKEFAELFQTSKEYIDKELSELDKIKIQRLELQKYINETTIEYDDYIYDPQTGQEIPIKSIYIDSGAEAQRHSLEVDEKREKLIIKIDSAINDMTKHGFNISQDTDFHSYEDSRAENIELIDRFIDIIICKRFKIGFLHEICRALELTSKDLYRKHHIIGKGRKNSAWVEDDRPMTQEIFKILNKYLKAEDDKQKQQQEENKKFIDEMKELGLYSDEDFQDN